MDAQSAQETGGVQNCRRVMTAAQMRAAEQAAIDSGQLTGLGLMERAAEGVVAAVLSHFPRYRSPPVSDRWRATVLSGPGNNGGDGFAIARLLADRGWDVDVHFHGQADGLPPDARLNHDRWASMGNIHPLSPMGGHFNCEVIIDALFGTGLTRPVDAFAGLFDAIRQAKDNSSPAPHCSTALHLVAVDVPSGLCADSGRLLLGRADGLPYPAHDLTVTFETLKPGHLLQDGPALCGAVHVVPLGLTAVRAVPDICVAGPTDLRKDQGHKFDHGHALVVAGGPGHGGAARLAARAALRTGAGLVTLCPPGAAMPEHAGPPDALMRRPVDDAAGLAALIADPRVTAVCLGPGCGVDRAAALLDPLLDSGRAAVLDADALTALAGRGLAGLHEHCVLTPHAGEFARLFPDLAGRLAAPAEHGPAFSRVDAVVEAARRSNAAVLLKGPDTVIASPCGRVRIHSAYDVPWLATAGSGDALAGIITGLLARSLAPAGVAEGRHAPVPLDAAATGAWLHAAAARRFGPGLTADDLPDQLPGVFRDLGL